MTRSIFAFSLPGLRLLLLACLLHVPVLHAEAAGTTTDTAQGDSEHLAAPTPRPAAIANDPALAPLMPEIARKLGAKVDDLSAHLMPGGQLIEVFWLDGGRMVYLDRDVRFILVGSLFDAENKHNLTKLRSAELNRIPFDSLPLDKVIKVVKGNGATRFAVFEDPDCPFCRAMESRLDQLDDYTAYILLFPLKELHPGAEAAAKAIWCAEDPSAAWQSYMHTQQLPVARDCETPIVALRDLARRHHIEGTPTLVMPDGEIVEGMPDLATLKAKAAATPQQ